MLFGHQNDVSQQQGTQAQSAQAFVPTQGPTPGVNPLALDPATGASLPTVPPDSPGPVDTADEPSVLDQPASAGFTSGSMSNPVSSTPTSFPAEPETVMPDSGMPFSANPTPPVETPSVIQEATGIAASLDTPATTSPSAVFAPDPAPTADTAASASVFSSDATDIPAAIPDSSGLLGLKQQAISQLSPLIGHLDQAPEEKFRTTMMLIQSTDNPSLLQDAYNVAQSITDDKVRAQALLDVVNEINYFTQQQDAQGE